MSPSRIFFRVLVPLFGIALAGCAKLLHPQRPSVILISVDTLRADHLPAYGYRQVDTPAIDALARDAIRFDSAYSQVPLTLPSHAVILTGLLPYQNGVRDNVGFRLSERTPTAASLWKASGYATGAAVSSLSLRSDRGLASGFDFYDDQFLPQSADERPGDETVAKLTTWMETVSGRPVLAFLHLYEPHAPWAPREPYGSRYASRPYDGEIASADAAVGQFIAFLKRRNLYDQAVIVFLSDHGEGLGDHGEQEHGVFLYREAIRVPLLIKLPRRRSAGQVVSRPVGLVDLLPTLAHLTRVTPPPGLTGADLLSTPSGDPLARRLYSESLYPRLALGWSDLASLTDGRHQYIESPHPELYDIVADPQERHNLAGAAPAAFRSMRADLSRLSRPEANAQPSPEEIRKLGSLGYISMSRGAAPSEALPDPKDKIATLSRYKRLFDLFHAGQDREAVAAAQEILAEDSKTGSDNSRAGPFVWRILASCRERLGDTRGAAHDLEQAIAHSGGATGEELSLTYQQLAGVLEKAGDRAAAEKTLKEAAGRGLATDAMKIELARLLSETGRAAEAVTLLPAQKGSEDPSLLDLRGVVLAEAGRLADARAEFVAAVEADPRHAGALFHLGMLSLREADPGAALQWFERSLASRPHSAGTFSGLGLAQSALGDSKGALDSWEKALALDPGLYDTLYNRSVLLGRVGRVAEARKGLEEFLRSAPADRYRREREEARRLLKSLESAAAG